MEKNKKNEKIELKNDVDNKKSSNKVNRTAWLITGIVSLALLVGAGFYIYTYTEKQTEITGLQENNEVLNENLEMRDSLINEWVNTLIKIEEDLITLQGKEESLIQKSNDPELTPGLRESILKEIQEVNTLLQNNKAKIASLNKKLKNSGIQIAALQKKVNNLEHSITERDSVIDGLKTNLVDRDFMLSELNTVVDSLSTSIEEKENILAEQSDILDKQHDQLNTAFVVAGNPKELEEQGIITREGGFLGLGKSKSLSPDLPQEIFKEVKISDTRKIAVNGEEFALISEHPSESYTVVSSDSLQSYLEITNPEEFWKITRYAVVEIKRN